MVIAYLSRKQEKTMKPHEERVVAEADDMGERLTKLTAFISGNAAFTSLDMENQQLLRRQRDVMSEYLYVLGERIALFPA
jgi:hypothetical protein